MNKISSIINGLFNINPLARKLVLLFLDVLFLITSLFICGWLINFEIPKIFYAFMLSVIAIPFYIFTGQYKGITRFANSNLFYLVTLRNIFITSISLIILRFLDLETLNIFESYLLRLFLCVGVNVCSGYY